MRHDGDISALMVGKNPVDCVPNAPLRVNCTLPSTNAALWLGKKAIGRPLEFIGREISRRASVVLAKIDFVLMSHYKASGKNRGGVNCLYLAARPNRGHSCDNLVIGKHGHARHPCVSQPPLSDIGTRNHRDFRMGNENQVCHL